MPRSGSTLHRYEGCANCHDGSARQFDTEADLAEARQHHRSSPPKMIDTSDTIAPVATAPGAGGVGIVRLSGTRARAIAEAIGGHRLRPRHAASRSASAMTTARSSTTASRSTSRAPRATPAKTWSNCRRTAARPCWRSCCSAASPWARAARGPGEFSERAFLNDKLDLAQAEAVADLIAAADATRRTRRAPRARWRVLAARRIAGRRSARHPRARRSRDRLRRRTARHPRRGAIAHALRQRRARPRRPAARRRTWPAPARRPACGDRRAAQCRQEFAAQRARPAAIAPSSPISPVPRATCCMKSCASTASNSPWSIPRGCAKAAMRSNAKACAARAANSNAPTSPSSCSMRATPSPAAPPSTDAIADVPQRLWLHNKADLLAASAPR